MKRCPVSGKRKIEGEREEREKRWGGRRVLKKVNSNSETMDTVFEANGKPLGTEAFDSTQREEYEGEKERRMGGDAYRVLVVVASLFFFHFSFSIESVEE